LQHYFRIITYQEYFAVLNNNFRQWHSVLRVKDSHKKLKDPEYKLHCISMCISFNQEQIGLFEIFRKTDRKNFVPDSPTFPVDSDESQIRPIAA